ncbi:MAG: hypothetical protein ACO3YY_06645 [Phycisphaerales bacterium]|jgi:hypothetical protein|nr:hypothetical protein [Planctomycetota bacterium]
MPRLVVRSVAIALAAAAFAGCASESATFTGRPGDQVWTAMVAVAEEPRYSDWRVLENRVVVDDERREIFISRHLRRDLVRPGADEVRQDRNYRFDIVLETSADEEADTPPTITFSTVQPIMPSRLFDEAEQYFAEVAELLGEVKETPAPRPLATEPPRTVRE